MHIIKYRQRDRRNVCQCFCQSLYKILMFFETWAFPSYIMLLRAKLFSCGQNSLDLIVSHYCLPPFKLGSNGLVLRQWKTNAKIPELNPNGFNENIFKNV